MGQKVYLIGPMTGLPELNVSMFMAVAAKLRLAGFEVISPAEPSLEETDWAIAMKRNIRWLLDCEGVVVLPGWESSKGAKIELMIATNMNMIIHHWDILNRHLDKIAEKGAKYVPVQY
jgi:hypothetical protein